MVLRILAIIVLVLVPLDFALAIEMYGDEGTPSSWRVRSRGRCA